MILLLLIKNGFDSSLIFNDFKTVSQISTCLNWRCFLIPFFVVDEHFFEFCLTYFFGGHRIRIRKACHWMSEVALKKNWLSRRSYQDAMLLQRILDFQRQAFLILIRPIFEEMSLAKSTWGRIRKNLPTLENGIKTSQAVSTYTQWLVAHNKWISMSRIPFCSDMKC